MSPAPDTVRGRVLTNLDEYLRRAYTDVGGWGTDDDAKLREELDIDVHLEFWIQANERWARVNGWIFRSWAGARELRHVPAGLRMTYHGPVFYLGTGDQFHKE